METIKIKQGFKKLWKTHEVVIYDNDDEMPIENFIQLQKNYLIMAAVGTTIGDFDKRLETINKYIAGEDKKKARNEVNNMRNLFFNIIHTENTSLEALSCIVYSINGDKRECTGSGIEKTSELLSLMGITMKDVRKAIDVKKKIEKQMSKMFPESYDELNTEWFGAKKRLVINKLKNIIERNKHTESINKGEKKVAQFMYSYKFGNEEGEDVAMVKRFEQQCAVLQKETFKDVKKMTVREFYTLIKTKRAA